MEDEIQVLETFTFKNNKRSSWSGPESRPWKLSTIKSAWSATDMTRESDHRPRGELLRIQESGQGFGSQSALPWLTNYYAFAFWIGLSPFRFKFDETEKTFVAKTNRCQKALYFVLRISCVVACWSYAQEVIKGDQGLSTEKVAQFFYKSHQFSWYVLRFTIFTFFRKNEDNILKAINAIFNFDSERPQTFPRNTTARNTTSTARPGKIAHIQLWIWRNFITERNKSTLFCVLTAAAAMSYILTDANRNFFTSQSPTDFLASYAKQINATLIVFPDLQIGKIEDVRWYHIFVVIILDIDYLSTTTVDALLIPITCVYSKLVENFLSKLAAIGENCPSAELEAFLSLMTKFNDAFRAYLGMVAMGDIPYYIWILTDDLLVNSPGILQIRRAFFFCNYFAALYRAARTQAMLEATVNKFCKTRVEDSFLDLFHQETKLSISTLYSMDKAFWSTVSGAIFTYSALSYQFKPMNDKKDKVM